MVRRAAAAWDGPPAPPVELLPEHVSVADVERARRRRCPTAPAGLAVGVRERDLAPAELDLVDGGDPHLLVLRDARSGRTTALRTLLSAATDRFTPEELRVVVVDYRRNLLDAVPREHLSGCCASAPAAAGTLAALAEKLTARLPGPEVTVEQLRRRDWWSGPRALVVFDDHELLAMSATDPLSALLDLLPVAGDVGLHVVVARGAGGSAAALVQPVLRRLRDVGSSALLLSGPPDEGAVLHGGRFRARPPGRGQLVTRRSGRDGDVLQVAVTEEPVGLP